MSNEVALEIFSDGLLDTTINANADSDGGCSNEFEPAGFVESAKQVEPFANKTPTRRQQEVSRQEPDTGHAGIRLETIKNSCG